MQAIAFMLDTNRWNTLYKGNGADYAIGGPTLDLLSASYNKYYEDGAPNKGVQTIKYIATYSGGYHVGTGTAVPTGTSLGIAASNSLYALGNSTNHGTIAINMLIASPMPNPSLVTSTLMGTVSQYLGGGSLPSASGSVSITNGVTDFTSLSGAFRPIVRLSAETLLMETAEGFKIIDN